MSDWKVLQVIAKTDWKRTGAPEETYFMYGKMVYTKRI